MHAIQFPKFSGLRCLMMPYRQGDPDSVPDEYAPYRDIIATTFVRHGDIGFLTIDESRVEAGKPHRGARAKFGRALHTEAGWVRGEHAWGPGWGGRLNVRLWRGTRILLANNLDGSCALWDAEHEDTSEDGDIGDRAAEYPYESAVVMRAGDVHEIGILTPHESLPVARDFDRQFLRIVGAGVYGREPYFTENPRRGDVRGLRVWSGDAVTS